MAFVFGTVGSPTNTPKKPGGSVGAIEQISFLGLEALELGWVQSVRISEASCDQIRSCGLASKVALSVHAPYFINLNATEDEWPKSRKRLIDAAYYGNLAGATDIVFHPGSYFGKPAAEVLPIAIERLAGCVQELRAAGNPVVLRPETMGKSALLGSLEDTLALSEAIPGVEPCLDFAHLYARGGDGSINTQDEWQELLDTYAKTLGENALQRLHIHLSGIEYTSKGERNHVPIQDCELDVNTLLRVLFDHDCSGRILCESPILEEDAITMQNIWKAFNSNRNV